MRIVLGVLIAIAVLILGSIWYGYGGWFAVIFCVGALFMFYAALSDFQDLQVVLFSCCLLLAVVGITILGFGKLKEKDNQDKMDKAVHATCSVYSKCVAVASKDCPSGFDVVARRLEYDENSDASTQHLYFKCKPPK